MSDPASQYGIIVNVLPQPESDVLQHCGQSYRNGNNQFLNVTEDVVAVEKNPANYF